jgi:maltose phosphorylase
MDPYLKVDPWLVVESAWNPADVRRSESIFSIGNGRFGQRANFEEGYSGDHLLGSYIGGVYYPDKTRVGWWKNGYPEYFAKVLNATNWMATRIHVNGERVDLNTAEKVVSFQRTLDMKAGLLSREVQLILRNGVEVTLKAERFCSMHNQDVAAGRMSLATNVPAQVQIELGLDGDVQNEDSNWNDAFWTQVSQVADDQAQRCSIVNRTNKTDFTVAATAQFSLENGQDCKPRHKQVGDASAWLSFELDAKPGQAIEWTRIVGIATSLHHKGNHCLEASQQMARDAFERGYERLRADHVGRWDEVWAKSDITIGGDVAAQQGIRFNVFHLNQTYQGDDPRLNIGPKGFTGEKYGGASYWDTEAYCLPFYLASHDPAVARQLLRYRYNHLEKAIQNAEKLGFGCGAALYPMVTMNGEECHNEWEITFEEIHRNGAIAYAIMNYERYTGDVEYTHEYGFPVLLGIARFWAQRVNWSEDKQKFVILGVTGPNEYENNVNNNWYTNTIAAWCMKYAADVAERYESEAPEAFEDCIKQYNFAQNAEVRDWRNKADLMYLPALENGVRLQQDGFMDKEQLSASDLPEEQRPINQHWSWDRILRSIFIKQADVLQGFYFFEDDFSEEEHRINFDFYEPKTVHESSLSPCIHVVLASRLNKQDKAYEMYLRTSRLDLDDYNREAYQGLHITSMAGTWLSVVEGFGGFRVRNGIPHFDGKLPQGWSELTFRIGFRDRQMRVSIQASGTSVTLLQGEPLDVVVSGELRTLEPA